MAVTAGIQVDGAKQLRKTLKAAGGDLQDDAFRPAHLETAKIVSTEGQAEAPRGVTGNLANSVRPAATKTAAIVRAGRARVRYAGVIEFGWKARNIKAQPFLIESISRTEPRWLPLYEDAVQSVLNTIKGIS